jgi:hypothetical protein
MSQIVLYDNRDSTNANKVRFLLAERCRPPAATGDRCSPVPQLLGRRHGARMNQGANAARWTAGRRSQ